MALWKRSSTAKSEAGYFSLAAITYGDAVSAMAAESMVEQELAGLLLMKLRDTVEWLSYGLDEGDFVMPLFDQQFPNSSWPNADLHMPGGKRHPADLDTAVAGLGAQLRTAFGVAISREQAVQLGADLTRQLVQDHPKLLTPALAVPCGYALGLGMEVTAGSSRSEGKRVHERRVAYGSLIGSWWAANTLLG